jgi:hypothetical protein
MILIETAKIAFIWIVDQNIYIKNTLKPQDMESYKVAVFGAGFVGIPTASVLALQNPSIEVPIWLTLVCRV